MNVALETRVARLSYTSIESRLLIGACIVILIQQPEQVRMQCVGLAKEKYLYLSIYIYIYIYTERERERKNNNYREG